MKNYAINTTFRNRTFLDVKQTNKSKDSVAVIPANGTQFLKNVTNKMRVKTAMNVRLKKLIARQLYC